MTWWLVFEGFWSCGLESHLLILLNLLMGQEENFLHLKLQTFEFCIKNQSKHPITHPNFHFNPTAKPSRSPGNNLFWNCWRSTWFSSLCIICFRKNMFVAWRWIFCSIQPTLWLVRLVRYGKNQKKFEIYLCLNYFMLQNADKNS